MLKTKILEDLNRVVSELGYKTTDIVCTIPKNPAFGDYSTNLALQLSKLESSKPHHSSLEIANQIVNRVQGTGDSKKYLEKVEVAGSGFINFFIKNEILLKNITQFSNLPKVGEGKKILIEYGHTNPLKEVHIGHLRTFILGESLSRILEGVGDTVFRANYQGDIGLHIAKAIFGINKLGLPSKELSLNEKAEFLGKAYALGNTEYETGTQAKLDIDSINKDLYLKDERYAQIYNLTRNWSLEYFEPIYQLLGVKYDKCFFESEVFEAGKQLVLDNVGKVFEKSEGAIIFPGEKLGLHNRVFITSAGNPTYEGKEVGLAKAEYAHFKYDKAIHVVAHEQAGYFQVVFKAIEAVFPELKDKKYHLSYGLVDLKSGKMSSRSGNVVTVDDLFKIVSEKVREVMTQNKGEVDQEIVKQVAIGAIKFAYLKFSPSPNMVFDIDESVSLDGDSGPYVQYTYARIQSVLKNAKIEAKETKEVSLDDNERMLLRQLMYFQDIILEVSDNYHPNLLASYLIELARSYNLFYQKCRILASEKEELRLNLSSAVAKVLQTGLKLLGIEAPERM